MSSPKPKEPASQLIRRSKEFWQTRRRLILTIAVLAFLVAIFTPIFSPDGIGFNADDSVTTTTEKDAQGQITKTVEATKKEPGKTVWDWLSLLGVPLTLAGLGYWLQTIQQKNQAEENRRQQERQADETKEEILQVYFDRLSVLLVDKNLLAIAAKKKAGKAMPEEEAMFGSALDVIRARTLSILRRFEDDKERQTSVIRFLIEADFISKLKLILSDADLSGAKLSGAELSGAELSKADLSRADLSGADLSDAKLGWADLSSADLSSADLSSVFLSDAKLRSADLQRADLQSAFLNNADLSDADLSGADLSWASLHGAKLSGAKLSGAKLSWANLRFALDSTKEQLTQALLCSTDLPPGINLEPDRDCEDLGTP